jgi:hypothetical protein
MLDGPGLSDGETVWPRLDFADIGTATARAGWQHRAGR